MHPPAVFPSIVAATLLAAIVLAPPTAPAATSRAGGRCSATIAKRLDRCLAHVARRTARCVSETRSTCPPADAHIANALEALENGVRRSCSAPSSIEEAGFDAALSLAGLLERLRNTCTGEIESLVARSFGGPHTKVYRTAGSLQRPCLEEAFEEGARLLRGAFRAQSRCVRRARRGMPCSESALEADLSKLTTRAAARIGKRCNKLPDLTKLEAPEFLERAHAQSRCLVPLAHGSADPLDLDCGPRDAIALPERAEAIQVVLDGSVWGTRCGDGSPYAFWVRLAPEGAPAENVVVHMQGGGVCLFNDDCRRVSSGLFRALDNNLASGGYMSNSNAANPFRDWTKVYLPYCTQDVHFGGGETDVFPDVTVHRFGARNVRAALRYVRDLLWTALDGTTEGYRPDRLRVLFGGTSAGGFGASFNYHYLLDDLRWSRATAAPGAALGIDNGDILGMRGLGILFAAWGAEPYEPPYCRNNRCSIVPELQALHAERLGSVPEQRFLNVSNQVDNTQVATTFFDSLRDWIDGHRAAYCATQGLPGVNYFLPARPGHIHTILGNGSQFPNLSSHGVTIGQWLGSAMADPSSVNDLVEEGDLAPRYGAGPYACPVGPPSP